MLKDTSSNARIFYLVQISQYAPSIIVVIVVSNGLQSDYKFRNSLIRAITVLMIVLYPTWVEYMALLLFKPDSSLELDHDEYHLFLAY